jgi:hypothetical protein
MRPQSSWWKRFTPLSRILDLRLPHKPHLIDDGIRTHVFFQCPHQRTNPSLRNGASIALPLQSVQTAKRQRVIAGAIDFPNVNKAVVAFSPSSRSLLFLKPIVD